MLVVKTAEATCIGHPDKLCDLIADQILYDILLHAPAARVPVEVLATGRRIIIAGEITCDTRPNIRVSITRALEKAGYVPRRFSVQVLVHRQAADIAAGVDLSLEARTCGSGAYTMLGADDQGTVYGYACSETAERLPLPLVLASPGLPPVG